MDLKGFHQEFPEFRERNISGKRELVGEYQLIEGSAVLVRHELIVCIDDTDEFGMPKVKSPTDEFGIGKEHHVNEDDGSFCLGFDEDLFINLRRRFPNGCTLVDFMEGPVRSFLLYQLAVRDGYNWPIGERKHFEEGADQYVEDLFAHGDRHLLWCILTYLFSTGRRRCFCGSRRRFKSCCLRKFRPLCLQVRRETALAALARLGAPSRYFEPSAGARLGIKWLSLANWGPIWKE